MGGFYVVTLQSGYPRNVVNLEQIMDAQCHNDIWLLVESARGESLLWSIVNLRCSNDSTFLRVDCCHESW